MNVVPITELLIKAKKEKYAVPHFNIVNMEFTQAIVEVANEENSPVILGVAQKVFEYMGIDYIVGIAHAAAKNSHVPIALHLDHGGSFELVMKCIRAGFSSVMIDGSSYPFEKNIALTKKVVEAAHAVGISVEAELGRIGGTEDGVTVDEKDATLPSAEEAIQFWEETKVDALAVAVGTAHGIYKSEPDIHFDTISKVANAISGGLVLHGGSGVPDGKIRKAIECGISKINVNAENQVAFTNAVRKMLLEDEKVHDVREFLGAGKQAVKEMVRSKIRLFQANDRI